MQRSRQAQAIGTVVIERPRLVRTDQGSDLRFVVFVPTPRDLHGGELDALWNRFHLPDDACCSLRRGRLRRRRLVFHATFDTRL